MRIIRNHPNGRAAEIQAEAHDGTTRIFRITGVCLQFCYKVDSRPWYDLAACDWLKLSPDELRAVACLMDGLPYGEENDAD